MRSKGPDEVVGLLLAAMGMFLVTVVIGMLNGGAVRLVRIAQRRSPARAVM